MGFAEMCSGSEAGSYLRRIDFVYHSTLGLRVINKKKDGVWWPYLCQLALRKQDTGVTSGYRVFRKQDTGDKF